MHKNTKVVWGALGIIGLMIGLVGISVPLYNLFCQVTGYGGTTMRADSSPGLVERTIKVRFESFTHANLPWKFQPLQREVTAHLGEEKLVFYRATNISDKPISGTASFNVTPAKTGSYFNKIECFCFTEQTLEPGQSVDMPVTFFVDPALAQDVYAQEVKTITLSYTFFRHQAETSAQ